MSAHRHGLVIGKFYPPTPGHEHLIREALARCERVTVLVEYSRFETIPARQRARWIEEMIDSPRLAVRTASCEVLVDYHDPRVWRAQVAIIEEALRGEPRPDALVAGERYGAELARRLGMALCVVDPGREAVPISATQVRADLYGNWSRLAPAVRAGLATRVVVLGSESTGTSTLADSLAAHYRDLVPEFPTLCVPEYGRGHTMERLKVQSSQDQGHGFRSVAWTEEDFRIIARRQTELEEAAARRGGPLLVCDTDALATAVWRRRYLGRYQPPSALPHHDLYLLTDHEGVPFVQDGTRDGQGVRAEMTGWFEEALAGLDQPWMRVSGSESERLSMAVRLIDRILERNRTFGAPLG